MLAVASCQNDDDNYKEYNWNETLYSRGTQPYDLKLFHDLVKSKKGGFDEIQDDLYKRLNSHDTANYFAIGHRFELADTAYSDLLQFVEKGNNAFVFTREMPKDLIERIYNYEYYPFFQVDEDYETLPIYFKDGKSFEFTHQKNNSPTNHYYEFIQEEDVAISDSLARFIAFERISGVGEYINLFRIKYGKGSFYFSTTPILFSNMHLREKAGFEHANKVLDLMSDGPLWWDESHLYLQSSRTSRPGRSPLKLLFSHYTLKWGWYLLLVSVLVYVLFRIKRKQRIIPVIPPAKNDSVEFIKKLGLLYFKKGNHQLIAEEMYDLFLNDARSHYHIDTNLEPKILYPLIAKKSGLPEEEFNEFIDLFDARFNTEASASQLSKLYNSLNHYYKNRK
ncbi:MAG: hypothetical protein KDC92_08130 [Bacteroidetes bacterium]|nr:hypothetical protein [Bacteroidota bacterium]